MRGASISTGRRIELLVMDPSHVVMIDFELPQERLVYYLAPMIGA